MKSRVRFETSHASADDVAASIQPDNTDEIETRVEDGRVVTVIERESPGSARTTADDYLRNLSIAADVVDG